MIGRKFAAALLTAFAVVGAAYAGHGDSDLYPAVRRVGGMITELGPADRDGNVYRFRARQVGPGAPVRFVPEELRGWRLTLLAGNRFSEVFEVESNTDYEITVTRLKGPLNGIKLNDAFIAEEIPPVQENTNATPEQ